MLKRSAQRTPSMSDTVLNLDSLSYKTFLYKLEPYLTIVDHDYICLEYVEVLDLQKI